MSGSSILPLRVALVGSGKMGLHHLKAIAASQRATVVGVADPAASADELAAVLPAGAIVVGSLEELLRAARPDVVHIVTPPQSHAALAIQAIDAGCHVYVEKPFTPTAEDAKRILDAASARRVTVCAGHQVLFEAPSLAVRERLQDIGRLVQIESYFAFKMVRRTITPVEQVKDILPHAVYPVVDQLRRGTGISDAAIEICGMSLYAQGEAYVLLRLGAATAVVLVTLNGRPVEQYQTLVGTNGSLRADYIGGFLDALVGPGTGPGVLLTPYRRAFHTLTGTTKGIVRLLRGGSYPGLRTLVREFYESIQNGSATPLPPASILDTVRVCEHVGNALDAVEQEYEWAAERTLRSAAAALPPRRPGTRPVLLTGGTGLLGRRIAQELTDAGYAVRVVARRTPPSSARIAGVEYVAGDLSRGLDPGVLTGIGFVVHAAAETAGGKDQHRRNSIEATRLLVEAAAAAGVKGLVHISSLAVLKTSREMGKALDESTPVDAGNLGRGPYVWGKAESELLAVSRCAEVGVPIRVIRPGPLVDYTAFHPPGRLGREVGPFFVAIGPRHGALSVCDVTTAARVVRSYIDDFDAAPPMLNLVEAPPETRNALMNRYRSDRPDLSVVWFPSWLLRALSVPMRLGQKLLLGSAQPIDVAAAFASERYRTDLAKSVIDRAKVAPAGTTPA